MTINPKAGYAGGMRKARKYDIANTNIAGLGTDLEKAVRQGAAETEKAWHSFDQHKATLKVWRIEQFQVVPLDKQDYGTFYDGDSYIILHSYHKNGGEDGALVYDIHFWIGSQSSQDEYGTAAYKTVELDDFLGGRANQFREVQDGESRRFRALFRSIIVMEGGVATGFRHVTPREYRHRLLHIKGKLNTIAMEVPIACASLNSNDSFVFDGGLTISVWHGKKAGLMEKNKAANLAQALDDSREGMAVRNVYDQDDDDEQFFKAMGVEKGTIKEEDDQAAEASDSAVDVTAKKLLKVSDASGSVEMTKVASGDAISRDKLTSADVYILDDGYEVMVWIGKDASGEERRSALNKAAEYLKKEGKPMETPICKLFEGGENELFEAAFEVGVRSGKDGSEATRSKAVAESAQATYKGTKGPGTVVDMDALYDQNGVDPSAWGGRTKAPSLYALEMQAKKTGAYSATSGWVSGHTERQRHIKQARINELEKQHASNRKARQQAGDSTFAAVKPMVNFSSTADAKKLRKAMKGLGTNDKVLIQILAHRTIDQRAAIVGAYSTEFGRDLETDITKDTSGDFRTALLALTMTESERYAFFLHKSMKGWGTENRLLIDVLCTKESDELVKIHSAYGEKFGKDLEKDIVGDTSGDFKRLLLGILECNRAAIEAPIEHNAIQADAEALYKAGEKKWGTDESKFIDILTHRSYPQIKEIVREYENISKKSLRQALQSELSGNFKNACIAIVDYAVDSTQYVCRRLFETMDGWGTKDWALIQLVVDHCESDIDLVKERFPSVHAELHSSGHPRFLGDMIRGDTSGNYKKLLLHLIGENTVA